MTIFGDVSHKPKLYRFMCFDLKNTYLLSTWHNVARERDKMKLTEKNLNNVFNYIITQISDEDFGEFDEETPIITAVQRTIEMLEEIK
mgnify:FL=1